MASGPSRCFTDVYLSRTLPAGALEQLHGLCSGSHSPELRGRFPKRPAEQLLTLWSDGRTLPAASQSWAEKASFRAGVSGLLNWGIPGGASLL